MNTMRTGKTRTALTAVLAGFAIVGLTACDADHLVAIFGDPTLPDPGPSCGVYCVDTETTLVGDPITFEPKQGSKVRFFNLTKKVVTVELNYSYPNSTTGDLKTLTIKPGKSKTKKIGNNVPVGTNITFTYKIGVQPPHGGPTMIIQAKETN